MSENVSADLRIFRDAVVIVTGGASGIGEAFAVELSNRGAVVVVADLDEELAAKVAARICDGGGNATSTKVDVSDHSAVKTLVETTVEQHGRLDFMFNLVGVIFSGTALDHTIDDWNRVLDVNVRGVVNGVEAAYPVMVEQGFGHIVNMSSMNGLVPFFNVPYTASRFAIVGLSLTLRHEAEMNGVRVSLLCPGAVRTPTYTDSGTFGKRLREVPEDVRAAAIERLHPIEPDRYVRLAIRGIVRNRAMIISPLRARNLWRSARRTPLLTPRMMFKYFVRPVLLASDNEESDS